MDLTPDQLAVIISDRCKDKPHKDYSATLKSWNTLYRKLREILTLKHHNTVLRILDASVTNNILRIVYTIPTDNIIVNEEVFVCDSSYLDMDFYDMRTDYESLQADLNARQKAIENEKARGARYRYYLRLRAEFDPDFVPPEEDM